MTFENKSIKFGKTAIALWNIEMSFMQEQIRLYLETGFWREEDEDCTDY